MVSARCHHFTWRAVRSKATPSKTSLDYTLHRLRIRELLSQIFITTASCLLLVAPAYSQSCQLALARYKPLCMTAATMNTKPGGPRYVFTWGYLRYLCCASESLHKSNCVQTRRLGDLNL